ncbi:Redox-sensing transcriptional repressor [Chitinispirillum alkaliphilum]|nr:Redox-sensing transcriptional repressor [Chitinispirillum alkaliphilum]
MEEQIQLYKRAALPTIRRLPSYLSILYSLKKEGLDNVSGTLIAQRVQCEPIQVRKDLAVTGIVGRPRVGFEIKSTISAIENFLGWDNSTDAFLIGAGSLGTALLGYGGFVNHNLNVIAAFDSDESKIGTVVHGKKILDINRLENLASRMHVNMAILTVPGNVAQKITDRLVENGVNGIWNFTSEKLVVPTHVVVQNEDLSSGLAVLCARLKGE